MAQVVERTGTLRGMPAHWWEADAGDSGRAPCLYVHGVPTHGEDWLAFLARTGGLAPDLAGFGQSTKRADLPYDMRWEAAWLGDLLDELGIDRVRLVVHDWGGLALIWAQQHPERVERLVVMNAVPLLPGYRWHRIARVWRTKVAGELLMGATSRFGLKQLSRESNATPGPMPDAFLDLAMQHFDTGTQRAILRLYRSADEPLLAEAGRDLGALTCPALVVWGEQDPYIDPRFAQAYADALGGEARVELVPDAGHWPWLDRPDLVDRVAAFLDG